MNKVACLLHSNHIIASHHITLHWAIQG